MTQHLGEVQMPHWHTGTLCIQHGMQQACELTLAHTTNTHLLLSLRQTAAAWTNPAPIHCPQSAVMSAMAWGGCTQHGRRNATQAGVWAGWGAE